MVSRMPVLTTLLLMCAASVFVVCDSAYAGAIFELDARSISGTATTLEDQILDDQLFGAHASAFSPFSASDTVNAVSTNASASASAEQDSSLTANLITALGAGSASATATTPAQAGARGSSDFFIDFRLEETHQISLVGELTGVGLGGARIDLIDLTGLGSYIFSEIAPIGGSTSFDQELLLVAAHYRLTAVAGADFHFLPDQDVAGNGTYSFQMGLTPVSEPAMLALFGLGLAGIRSVRRARNRA